MAKLRCDAIKKQKTLKKYPDNLYSIDTYMQKEK
ncbi:MAG: hypothetical protein C5S38_06610 [Candidatus Methanophagaceae archaeon]|nr:MAG: hypothetical protein C5S38_06610 [Methanophagales archaeon]